MTKLKLLKELRNLGCPIFDIQLDDYKFSFDLDNNPHSYLVDAPDIMLVEVNNKNWKNSCCLEITPFFTSCYLYDGDNYLPTYILKQVKKVFKNNELWEQIRELHKKVIKDNFYIEDKKDE